MILPSPLLELRWNILSTCIADVIDPDVSNKDSYFTIHGKAGEHEDFPVFAFVFLGVSFFCTEKSHIVSNTPPAGDGQS